MNVTRYCKLFINALEDLKCEDILAIDIHKLIDIIDHIIVCTVYSMTHANAVCNHMKNIIKDNQVDLLGVEGYSNNSGWILMDLGDIVIHIMLKSIRDFYQIENLWQECH